MNTTPKWMEALPTSQIFPEFYHSIGRTKSDRAWLSAQLSRLSRQNRIEACLRYREWFVLNGRRKANTELLQFVLEHGLSVSEMHQVKSELNGNQIEIMKKLEKIKNSKPIARSKHGEIFQKRQSRVFSKQ